MKMAYDSCENWGVRRGGSDYNIEDLTRYFREGNGIRWSRLKLNITYILCTFSALFLKDF